MIDARELRLGNLIHFPFIGSDVEVLGLALKDDYKLFIQSNLRDSTFFELPEKYQPIPLTEEWLERFGFENFNNGKLGTSFQLNHDNFTMVSDNGLDVILYGELINNELVSSVKHVHQLQNLYYALTNQELELK